MREQLSRSPFAEPSFHISQDIKTLEDLESWVDPQDKSHFWVEDYEHHPHIKYPFAA